MKNESTSVAHRETVAEAEIGATGRDRETNDESCATVRSAQAAASPPAGRIDGGGELPLAALASLDPRELAILAALGC